MKKKRIQSLDLLKGMIMVIMCIDHARDYTMYHPSDPMQIDEDTHWGVFLFRILAHLCAPAFILMAGVSARIVGKHKDKKSLSRYLLERGLILCVLEVTLVNWGWSFNPFFRITYLQIIWAIGIAMIALAGIIHLKRWMIALLAAVIIFGHNLFDGLHFAPDSIAYYVQAFTLKKTNLEITLGRTLRTTYPVIPVIGLISLGYYLGQWYVDLQSQERQRRLLILSGSMLSLFCVFRLVIGYGDPYPVAWTAQFGETFMSIINTTKYPFSLHFVLLYLGGGLGLLGLMDAVSVSERNPFMTFGRTPMIFYICHLYLLHTGILIYQTLQGAPFDLVRNLGAVHAHYGYPLWLMFINVGVTLALLYPLCQRYYLLKASKRYKFTAYI